MGKVNIIKETGGGRFDLHMFEDKDAASKPDPSCDQWHITQDANDSIPSDEVKSFKVRGSKGLKVEFFRDKNFEKDQSWSEITLTADGQVVIVDQMDREGGGYHKHTINGDIGGKVDAIRLSLA